MATKRRSAQEWREDILAHARTCWPAELSVYDFARRLSSSGLGAGRGAQQLRRICEELTADGLFQRSEQHNEGAPFGRPAAVRYRAVIREDAAA